MKCPSASGQVGAPSWAASCLIMLGSDAWLWPQAGFLFVVPLAGQWEEGVKEGGADSPDIGSGVPTASGPETVSRMPFCFQGALICFAA